MRNTKRLKSMKPNFSEYIQYYLTDFEWLIVLACLWNSLGTKYFLSRYPLQETEQQLQSIKNLPSLDLKIYPLECKHYHRWKDILGTSREGTGINVSCKDWKQLLNWVTDYIEYYKNTKIRGTGLLAFRYSKSMHATLNLLDQYEDEFGESIVLSREVDDGNGNILKANDKSRLFEDLFVLGQKGFVNFTNLEYAYAIPQTKQARTDIESIRNSKQQLTISLSMLLKEPINDIENKLFPSSSQQKAITALPAPYNKFEIKRTNPLDVKTTSIFYEGKKLNFKYNTQEYRLLECLINKNGVVGQKVAIDTLRLKAYFKTRKLKYAKDGAEIEHILQKRKYDNLKLYCSRVRQLLPKSVTLVLDKNGVYLRKS